jgi:hypothetical protein
MSKPPQSKPPKQKQPQEPQLEHSEFAGEFEDEGITVLVDIFRPAGTNGDWTLEVISQTEVVTTWDENFATDKDAWEEFLATAERDGLGSFLEEDEEPSVH